MKRFLTHFLFTILFLIILYLGFWYKFTLKFLVAKSLNPFYYLLFSALFPIVIGIILGFPRFFNTVKKPGKWSIDFIKLSAIGIPTLLINLSLILITYTPVKFFYIPTIFNLIMGSDSSIVSLCGTIFGYLLISSFDKAT